MKYLFSGLTSVPLAGPVECQCLSITGPENSVRDEIYRKGKKESPLTCGSWEISVGMSGFFFFNRVEFKLSQVYFFFLCDFFCKATGACWQALER